MLASPGWNLGESRMGSYGESRMGGVLEMYFVDAWTTGKKDTAIISQPEGKN